MSDGQPPRSPGDPGPDWWPRFSARHVGLWTAQGFFIPLVIYLIIWLVGLIGMFIAEGSFFSSEAIRKSGMVAVVGYYLTGGSIALTQIFHGGAKWKTLFRVIGFTLSMMVQWNLNGWILGLSPS